MHQFHWNSTVCLKRVKQGRPTKFVNNSQVKPCGQQAKSCRSTIVGSLSRFHLDIDFVLFCLEQWFLTWGKFTLGVNFIFQGVNLLNQKLQPMLIFINHFKL